MKMTVEAPIYFSVVLSQISQIKGGIAKYFIPFQLSNVFSSTQSCS